MMLMHLFVGYGCPLTVHVQFLEGFGFVLNRLPPLPCISILHVEPQSRDGEFDFPSLDLYVKMIRISTHIDMVGHSGILSPPNFSASSIYNQNMKAFNPYGH